MGDGIFAKELEDELMKYTRKCEYKVDANLVEKSQKTDDEVQSNGVVEVNMTECTKSLGNELVEKSRKTDVDIRSNGDVEVNITECTKSLGSQLVVLEDQDRTESSSSFGDSNIGAENVDTLGDPEVSSDFRGDAEPAVDFDGFGETFRMRKKKLTAHWRAFIQPLMWRCKWVELQVKKLESQAEKYDSEVRAYKKQDQTQLDNSAMGDSVKSLPFLRNNDKSVVFRRKKRRRTETTEDVAAYMSRHNLFSCFENRKCLTEGAFTNNEPKNSGTEKFKIEDETWSNDELSFEPRDADNSLENILRKIEVLKSQVGKLKSQADRIMNENAARLSFADTLILSPPHSENGTEGPRISSQSTSVLASQLAVTHGSIGEGPHRSVADGVFIDNQRVGEKVKIDATQRSLDLKEGPGQMSPPPDLAESDPLAEDPSPPKIRSIAKLTSPKSKRKRGRKRVAAGRRSKRSTG